MSRLESCVRLVLRKALVWGQTLLLCTFMAPLAQAGSSDSHGNVPQNFDRFACYQLVQREGRMIAWARWEEQFSLEKMRAGQFGAGTPSWIVDIVQEWIADAYSWSASDEQILQWAQELGSTDNLPSVSQLSVHETIAIWMRRIGQSCNVHAEASASAQQPAIVGMERDSPRN